MTLQYKTHKLLLGLIFIVSNSILLLEGSQSAPKKTISSSKMQAAATQVKKATATTSALTRKPLSTATASAAPLRRINSAPTVKQTSKPQTAKPKTSTIDAAFGPVVEETSSTSLGVQQDLTEGLLNQQLKMQKGAVKELFTNLKRKLRKN